MTVCRMNESKWNRGEDIAAPFASSCDFTFEYSSFASRRFFLEISLKSHSRRHVITRESSA